MRLPAFHLIQSLLAFVLFAGVPGLACAEIRYVDKANPTPVSPFVNGWVYAANNIQTAIDVSVDGDIILVAGGIYNEGGRTNAYNGNALTNRVVINKAITLQAASANPADTLIVGASHSGTNGPSAIRCVAMTKGNLTGFTLTNGHTLKTGGDALGNDRQGGGLFSTLSTSIISNCVFIGNGSDGFASVTYGGGAIFTGSKFYDCTIAYNTCDIGSGGGAAGGTYWNCHFVSNSAGSSGGGAFNASGVYGCEFVGNTAYAGAGGGGLYNVGYAGDIISNCVFRANVAVLYGGGVRNGNISTIRIRDTLFDGNQAGSIYIGSAIHGNNLASCINCEFKNHPGAPCAIHQVQYMTNCLIHGNGAVFYSSVNAVNCTIADNTGGVFQTGTSSLTNCIVYGNSPNLLNGLTYYIGYSCVYTSGVTATIIGTGNITNNPIFVNPQAGNYRLDSSKPPAPRSPCFNSGVNQDWMTNSVDLDGRIRLRHGQVDMGAYELWIKSGTIFRGK